MSATAQAAAAPSIDSQKEERVPRSEAIVRDSTTFSWGSAFSCLIYPGLGVLVLALALGIAAAVPSIELHAWYLIPILASSVGCLLLCNIGIGSLHRVWQHRGGEMSGAASVFVALNCILAMQGSLREWINYHAAHHRFADQAGDPHNPNEGVLWAWMGWLLWRDPDDMGQPMPKWVANNRVVAWADRFQMSLSAVVHLLAPIVMYVLFWIFDGPMVLAALIHAAVVIMRGVHFHATIYGINVAGHQEIPTWQTYLLALATGGEAFHDHHHIQPRSILHLPSKGVFNRIFDYNGTWLLLLRKLGMLRDDRIAPQFA